MKKGIVIALIVLIIGICLALVGFSAGGAKGFWIDRSGFHLSNAELGKLVKVDETFNSFKNIDVSADFLDKITIKEGTEFRVQGSNYERFGGITAELEGNTLVVKAVRENRWMFNFGIDDLANWDKKHDECQVEITYPKGTQFDSVGVVTSAGIVNVRSLASDTLRLENDFGDMDVSGVRCSNMDINLNAGDIKISNIEASGDIKVISDFGRVVIDNASAKNMGLNLNSGDMQAKGIRTGDISIVSNFGKVSIDDATADSMTLRLTSGDMQAKNITTGSLSAQSDFGKIDISGLKFTGLCEIFSTSGDVILALLMNEDEVGYELLTDAGDVKIDGRSIKGSVVNRLAGAGAELRVEVDFGSIRVNFAGM